MGASPMQTDHGCASLGAVEGSVAGRVDGDFVPIFSCHAARTVFSFSESNPARGLRLAALALYQSSVALAMSASGLNVSPCATALAMLTSSNPRESSSC